MEPIQSGSNPTNNPRLDLLHNTGSNQQLNGAAGSYGPAAMADSAASAFHGKPVIPPPAKPEKPASSYIAAAQSKRPATPVPTPPPPTPQPRPVPAPPPPPNSGSKGRVIGIIVVVVILLAALGAGGWWWTHRAKPAAAPATTEVTPVTPTNLSQLDNTNTPIDAGGTTKQSKLIFEFNVATSANSGSLTPEVELEPVATGFTGQPTITGQAVSASGGTMQFSVDSSTLKNGAYHWQARVGTDGQYSSWAVFGSDPTATAFTVATTAPTTPAVSTIGGAAVANPTVVTSNQPVIVGTAGAGDTITVSVSPDSQQFTTTANSSGAWTVTPTANIPNGLHQLSITATDTAGVVSAATQIALSVNPATAADTTPSPSASTPAASSTAAPATAAPAPAPAKNLAGTGDNTTAVSLLSLAVMIMAAAGIVAIRRRYAER